MFVATAVNIIWAQLNILQKLNIHVYVSLVESENKGCQVGVKEAQNENNSSWSTHGNLWVMADKAGWSQTTDTNHSGWDCFR